MQFTTTLPYFTIALLFSCQPMGAHHKLIFLLLMDSHIKHYTFLSNNRKKIKQHRNREHSLKRIANERLFDHVRL
jgi:hypothetical protein